MTVPFIALSNILNNLALTKKCLQKLGYFGTFSLETSVSQLGFSYTRSFHCCLFIYLFIYLFMHVFLICFCLTLDRVFHQDFQHRYESWKPDMYIKCVFFFWTKFDVVGILETRQDKSLNNKKTKEESRQNFCQLRPVSCKATTPNIFSEYYYFLFFYFRSNEFGCRCARNSWVVVFHVRYVTITFRW